MEEVALVLARIDAPQKFRHAVVASDARIVAGGNPVCAHAHGVIEKGPELDLRIAENVRIGRAAGRVFAKEVGKDAFLIFAREIDCLDVDADHVGDSRRINEVLARGAVLAVVIILPVFHEETDDFIALFLEEPGAYRRIHASGEADDDFFFRHGKEHPRMRGPVKKFQPALILAREQ